MQHLRQRLEAVDAAVGGNSDFREALTKTLDNGVSVLHTLGDSHAINKDELDRVKFTLQCVRFIFS